MKALIATLMILFLNQNIQFFGQTPGMPYDYDAGTRDIAFEFDGDWYTENVYYTKRSHIYEHWNNIVYQLILTRQMDIEINHCGSTTLSSGISVYDAQGKLKVSKSLTSSAYTCNPSANEVLQLENLPAGTYYVVSSNTGPNPYEGIIQTHIYGSEFFPLDYASPPLDAGTFDSHSPIDSYEGDINTHYCGNLDGECTNDALVRFTLTEPMNVWIANCGSAIPVRTSVYLSTGQMMAEKDFPERSPCTDKDEGISLRNLLAGTYYVVSQGISKNGLIPFRIHFSPALPGESRETAIDAGTFTAPRSYTDVRNSDLYSCEYHLPGNDIFYKFSITKPSNISISHCGSEIPDTYVFLLNSSGSEIIFNNTYTGLYACGNPEQAYLRKNRLPAGSYYVVSKAIGSNGLLSTTIECTEVPAAGESLLNPIDVGTVNEPLNYSDTRNSIDYRDDHEGSPTSIFYRFTLKEKMNLKISHCGSLIDTELQLLNATKNQITGNDNYTQEGHCPDTLHAYISYPNAQPGVYYVVSKTKGKDNLIQTHIETSFPYGNLQVSPEQNYILTITPLIETEDVSLISSDQAYQNIQYFDGLGRPVQTVQRGITPQKKDLVSIQEYDRFGREANSWLPIPSQGAGIFVDPETVKSSAIDFYGDQKPFAMPIYEGSPMNRVLEQYGPGQKWHPEGGSKGHPVKLAYYANTSTGNLSCALYTVTGTVKVPTLSKAKNYDAGQLYVTEIKDEDGNTSYEFKDKLGQVVLIRQMNENSPHDTYYVYDAFGNLTFVLPPIASDALYGNGTWTADNEALKQYAYLYRYDYRHRPINKRLPGADWIYYVYDKADHLILSQNGEQRKKSEWIFNKYDAFGRIILSGVYTDASTQESLSTQYKDTIVKESPRIDNYGYSWNTPPIVTYDKVLTVNYYDDYEHLLNQEPYFRNNLNYVEKEDYGKRHMDPGCTDCASKGLLTGTRVKMLDGSGEIVTALYYDDKGRVIQKKSTNHLGGFDNEYYAYTFTGQPIRQHMEHSTAHSGFTETTRYSYDHAGRLINTRHQVNDEPEVELAGLAYDALGRLNKKQISEGMETLSYGYNIRGWTKSIESNNFSETLHYESPDLWYATPCYNGNISQVNYRKPTQAGEDAFAYQYDHLNRLKNSMYHKDGYFHDGYSESFRYDKHGNINVICRMGALSADPLLATNYDIVDYIGLYYSGNQLKIANEYVNVPHNFYGAPYFKDYKNINSKDEYGYDSNGNMLYDFNKGVSWIQYNCFNLPEKLQTTQGNTLENIYDATGVKRRMVARTASGMYIPAGSGSIQEVLPSQLVMEDIYNYSSNVVYSGPENRVSKILLPDGYVVPEDQEGWGYAFQLKDHLGSIQVELDDYGYVISNMNYYASGMEMVRMENWMESSDRFTGKEYQPMHELNWYDFLARTYDPPTMRFTTMDPLAEKYYSISPYAYCGNNPVNYIDPTGMWIEISYNGVEYRYDDGELLRYETEGENTGTWVAFTAKKGTFLAGLRDALNAINKTVTGSELIDFFANDDNNAYIQVRKGPNGIDMSGSINTIYLDEDLNGSLIPTEYGDQISPFWLDAAHELAHRKDFILNGELKKTTWKETPEGKILVESEKYATHVENQIRADSRMGLRTHYSRQSNGGGWEPTRILNETRGGHGFGVNYITGEVYVPRIKVPPIPMPKVTYPN